MSNSRRRARRQIVPPTWEPITIVYSPFNSLPVQLHLRSQLAVSIVSSSDSECSTVVARDNVADDETSVDWLVHYGKHLDEMWRTDCFGNGGTGKGKWKSEPSQQKIRKGRLLECLIWNSSPSFNLRVIPQTELQFAFIRSVRNGRCVRNQMRWRGNHIDKNCSRGAEWWHSTISSLYSQRDLLPGKRVDRPGQSDQSALRVHIEMSFETSGRH